MIFIEPAAAAAVLRHCRHAYPHEACGLLIGRDDLLLRAVPCPNTHPDAGAAYEIDRQLFLQTYRQAKAEGNTIKGIYHSHPDAPPSLSAADRRDQWPDLGYLIVSVRDSQPDEIRWHAPLKTW